MKASMVALLSAFAVALAATMVQAGASLPDGDSDTIPDEWDNCSALSNTSQTDTDQDGYGNACDADYDNNGAVGGSDFSILSGSFLKGLGDPAYVAAADCDDNDTIGGSDFSCLSGSFLGSPGPSGLACAGTIPCTGI